MLAHRFKIPIVMQQAVTVLDAIGTDDQIRYFTNCDPQSAQVAMISGCFHGEVRVEHGDNRKAAQSPLHWITSPTS